MSAIKIHSKKE